MPFFILTNIKNDVDNDAKVNIIFYSFDIIYDEIYDANYVKIDIINDAILYEIDDTNYVRYDVMNESMYDVIS